MRVERTYYTLRDKIVTNKNMHKAAIKVIANDGSAGVDEIGIEEFKKNYKVYMRELYRETSFFMLSNVHFLGLFSIAPSIVLKVSFDNVSISSSFN